MGFPHAVVRKYLDDGGAREAALITYYGFLSLFPLLLLGVAVLTQLLANRPELLEELIEAIVPPTLSGDIRRELPSSYAALVVGICTLLFTGAGVVFSAYRTVNHLAAVPFRERHGIVSWLLRVFAALLVVLVGTAASAATATVFLAGSAVVAGFTLIAVVKLLLARPAPLRALWPAAVPGGVAIALVLGLSASVLPGMIRRAGPVYGAFATVAAAFTLLYFLSNILVYAAEAAAVRYARLWPRALDPERPTEADARALELLAREQERGPYDRIVTRQRAPGTEPAPPPAR
ncbi:YhjD/YihY/BrkB family envelope integrity protein [Paractinoplanes atraurantiacus]|uniref:YhjD/YihY/BrkB family envelope integrity protein n=1 Tax=Paractinoplanes atraurantiacus TaxID=1036182 RepID=UPI002481B578|nr:YhjD/YihY/BrkB family envelope integrity protein [Actinoplanes atraurantiacus]